MIPDAYFDRFETKKYRSQNPLQRALIRRFVRALHGLFIDANPVTSVLEIGCGEGFLSGYLSEKFPDKRFTGVDLSPDDVGKLRAKFPRIDANAASVYELDRAVAGKGPFDLVMCCEVLEHLDEPARALDQMLALAPKRLLLSVPHEPFFRGSNLLRGKNVARLGNDVEHVQHWSKRGFGDMLAARVDVITLTTSYPWILALAKPR
ncbi:MAG TPA: class I SAM-dependent methyltransferase [Byssovorax sp.]